jgi:para-nitrobenzyl esterase
MKRRAFLQSSTLAAAGAFVGVPGIPAAAGQARVTGPMPTVSVETTAGRVRGYIDTRINSFRGIPYAASTAGANRFLPPQKLQPWTGVREAIELGHRAPQLDNPRVPEWFVMDRTEPQGEDCLVVNVWTPGLSDNGKRPVLVWLHGGGFTGGSNGFTAYDGANLARKHKVVVVGVNHRLNAFGFMYLGDIGGEKYAAANVGMLDIVAALQWVRDNIERFGGDPGSVTVFGQSGGGSKVSTLLGMPAARGLFHRAYAMSGSQVRSLDRDQATRNTRAFLAKLNVSPANLASLQDIPMRKLRAALGNNEPGAGWGPVVDGRTIPTHIFDPVATDISSDVPLMIGSTETEVTWTATQLYDPLTAAELREDVAQVLRSDERAAQRVIDVYRKNRPRASNLDVYLLLATDASNFRTGTDTEADRKTAQGKAPVYKYYFQWYSPVRGGMLRSMHTMDVPFIFYNHEIAQSELGSGPDVVALAEKMSTTMVTFARTGNPNNSTIPHWAPYNLTQRPTLVWNNEVKVVDNPHGEEKAAVAAGRGVVPGRGRATTS